MNDLAKTLNEKLSASLSPESLKEVTETIQTAINENVESIKEKNKKFLFYTKRKLQEDAQKYGDYISSEKEKQLNEKVEAREKELNEKAEAYGKYLEEELSKKAEAYAEYVKEELSKKSEEYAEYVQEESYKDAEKYIVESFVKYVDSIKEDIEREVKSKINIITEKKDKDATRLLKEIKALIGYKESGHRSAPVVDKSDELLRRNHILESKLAECEIKIKELSKNEGKVEIKSKIDEEVSKLPLSKRAEARRVLATVKNETELATKVKEIKESIAKATVKPTTLPEPKRTARIVESVETKPASSMSKLKSLSGIKA